MIVLTVLASYHWLGFITGDATAQTGRTASLFYSNFHFISTGTNYLASQAPPSPLQNFWSLSVEEQFYVLYPTLFIVAAVVWSRVSLRLKLTVLLSVSIVASLTWSIMQTSNNAVSAYFSPFHPGLGTGPRRIGRRGEPAVDQASPLRRGGDDLDRPRRDPGCRLRLHRGNLVSGVRRGAPGRLDRPGGGRRYGRPT